MQPSRPNSAQPGRAPQPPRRMTGKPRLSAAALSPACSPSLARCLVGPTCRRRFLHPRAPPLSLPCGPGSLVTEPLPRASPFLSLRCGPACQTPPPRPRRGPASAHSCTSLDFSATTPAHAPISLVRAPPVPRARPPPHFAQLRSLSRFAHAAGETRPHSRPSSSPETAPSLPELHLEVRLPPSCLFYLIRVRF
jgi:hypothetical protein